LAVGVAGVDVGSANVTEDAGEETHADNQRQEWILKELENGTEVRIGAIVAHFKCSAATAKRDLAALRSRELIVFEGTARTGCYRLAGVG